MRLLACLFVSAALWAQDPFLRWLDAIAQRQLDERARALGAVQSRDAAVARRDEVRRRVLESIGGLPEFRGPLNARVTGELQGRGYVIEKVLFDSFPSLRIAANVYRPSAPGRYPAILVPAGHTQEGKAEPQWLAANLARKGFIALTYDPIGQGEREQSYLPQLGRALAGGGGNEHLELGARSILTGGSVARYFIHDARRAVDYLVSRPDVDPARLGVTGCSGGGAITAYAAAFDDRLKVAAAGCFISTYRTLFTGPTPDSEMALPRFLANGLDAADIFFLAAPKPFLMMATEEDYFTPASARPVYDEVRRFYSLLGAEGSVRFHVGPGPHGTPVEAREEIYAWMNRWLKGGAGNGKDEAVPMFPNRQLLVTEAGNVEGRRVWEQIRDDWRARRQPRSREALQAEFARLGIAPQPAGGAVVAKFYEPTTPGPHRAVIVVEEKRLRVPLFVQPSQSTTALCEALAKRGRLVLELSVRDTPEAYEGRPFLGNWLTNERADLVGENLAALRTRDILAAVSLLAARPDVDARDIRAYAKGAKGVWLLLAAAVEPRLKRVWLDRMPVSYQNALEAPLTSFLFDAMIPGFALHWDLPDVADLAGRGRLYRSDPSTWMNQVVDGGPGYRYRYVSEKEDALIEEFLQ